MDECTKLFAALDRQNEAHWHLHQLNEHYHRADAFRYSLNCFIRAMKEVPSLISMELQNENGFADWFRPVREELYRDPLFAKVSKDRDFIVHRGMLVPKSDLHVGVSQGPNSFFKIGIPFPASPTEDSDEVMQRFVHVWRTNEFIRNLIGPYDGQIPCVARVWRLDSFPDEEVRSVAVRAWKRVGDVLAATLQWLGHPPVTYDYPCLPMHEDARVGWKNYPMSIFGEPETP